MKRIYTFLCLFLLVSDVAYAEQWLCTVDSDAERVFYTMGSPINVINPEVLQC